MHSTPQAAVAAPREQARRLKARARARTCASSAWSLPTSSASARTSRSRSSELEHALDGRVTFDGGSIDGFVRGEELDMLLRPDPSTFAIYPWRPRRKAREARLICDIAMPDGTPFEGCPRTTLRRAIESAVVARAACASALEVEFYLFERTAARRSLDHDVRRRLVLRFLGQRPRRGGAQRDGLRRSRDGRSDRVGAPRARRRPARDRRRARRSARRRRSRAHAAHDRQARRRRFRPRRDVHAQTARGARRQRPARRLPPGRRSSDDETALYVVGGLLAHAPATTAICNPTVNSYKRLVAAWDAPIYTVWSERSANALVRVPPGRRRRASRCAAPTPPAIRISRSPS